MQVSLSDLTPEAREAVEKLVRETGKAVTAVLSELIVRGAGLSENKSGTSVEEQESAWLGFLASTAEWSKDLPEGAVVDDSRESIYSGRGE